MFEPEELLEPEDVSIEELVFEAELVLMSHSGQSKPPVSPFVGEEQATSMLTRTKAATLNFQLRILHLRQRTTPTR